MASAIISSLEDPSEPARPNWCRPRWRPPIFQPPFPAPFPRRAGGHFAPAPARSPVSGPNHMHGLGAAGAGRLIHHLVSFRLKVIAARGDTERRTCEREAAGGRRQRQAHCCDDKIPWLWLSDDWSIRFGRPLGRRAGQLASSSRLTHIHFICIIISRHCSRQSGRESASARLTIVIKRRGPSASPILFINRPAEQGRRHCAGLPPLSLKNVSRMSEAARRAPICAGSVPSGGVERRSTVIRAGQLVNRNRAASSLIG